MISVSTLTLPPTVISPWDGLIALQLFATWYSIVGIPNVHCSQLRAYSNQQPLTQVEYWPDLFTSVLIISVETIVVLEDIHVNEITPPIFSKKFSDVRGWLVNGKFLTCATKRRG